MENIIKKSAKEPGARKENNINQELTVKRIVTDKIWDSHWHDYLEIRLIVSGKGKVYINDQEHFFNSGCVYITTPSTLHMFIPDGEVVLYNATIKESYIFDEPIVQKLFILNEAFFRFDKEEFQKIHHLFELLEYENRFDFEYKTLVLKRLLECMLLYFMRHTDIQLDSNDITLKSIQIAQSFIKMNFRKKISVKTVASTLGYSPGYFSTLFRKVVGITFIDYLSNMRLEYAQKLLSLKKFTIKEVCEMSGFGSYSNFLKAFKKKYGTLPTNYTS